MEEQINQKPVDLLVIDGLEYLSDGTNSFEQLTTKRLRYLARKYNVAILISLTLGPIVDERYDKRPFLNDLEKWHSFQSDADKVLFLYRGGNYGYICPKHISDCLEVIIAKNSVGPMSVHHLDYRESSGYLSIVAP